MLDLTCRIIYNGISSTGACIPLGPCGRVPLHMGSVRSVVVIVMIASTQRKFKFHYNKLIYFVFCCWIHCAVEDKIYITNIKFKRNRQYWLTYLSHSATCVQKSLAEV